MRAQCVGVDGRFRSKNDYGMHAFAPPGIG